MTPSENENWIIETGDEVILKKSRLGIIALSPKEKLIYCLWVADYSMRNAGDIDTACDLYAEFQQEAVRISKERTLRFTCESFSLPKEMFAQQYFERFDRMCNEIKEA